MAFFRQSLLLFRHHVVQTIYDPVAQACGIKRWVAPTLRELERRKKKMGPGLPMPRATYLEWNYHAEIFAFAKRLGEEFNDDLLKRAFTHGSYIMQQKIKGNTCVSNSEDNKTLVKEGDLLISGYIRQKYENIWSPEIVNAIHAYLTTESMLSHVASHIGMKDLILSSDFPVENSTLANSFKAVVAALKHSVDEKRAITFIDQFLICQLTSKNVLELLDLKNPYEYLLQLLKDKGYREVEPRLCNQSASNTILANYQVGLYSNKKLLGIGWGESVEVAKDTAALDAIQRLQKINAF